jgi:hypothetical protein
MASPKYDKIKGKIAVKHPIFAKYKSEANKRKLCPHVLGYKKENSDESQNVDERVLCYQLEGPAPNPGWRFFDLTLLEIVEPGPPPSDWVTPGNYKSKWQNAVQKPKHKV